MLTVAEAAGARLAQMLDDKGLPEDVAVRLVCEGQDIALRQDSERPGDTAFQHEGRTVLLLDGQVSELLTNDKLDVEGAELTLQHPKDGE